MNKLTILAISGLLLGGGFALASELEGASTVRQAGLSTTVEDGTRTTDDGDRRGGRDRRDDDAPGAVDISGPCDEAEHANDPRCTGAPRKRHDDRHDDDAVGGVDISGPCDEAEHANDSRCTGQAAPRGDDDRGHGDRSGHRGGDNSGPGSGSSGPGHGGSDDDDDDRSGSNSGPGGGHDDD